MPSTPTPYRRDLARVHHEAFGGHVDQHAPAILARLAPVLASGGTVLEIGCGTGKLTRHLVAAGHRVIASDASPAMLELAAAQVPGALEHRVLALPADPLPAVDAVVATGHPLSYFEQESQVHAAFGAAADALRPGGVLAVDVFDLSWAERPPGDRPTGLLTDDWAMISGWEQLGPARYRRHLTTFVPTGADTWRRADEQHDIVLVDTSVLPDVLRAKGLHARVGDSFGPGGEQLPPGLVAVTGTKR